MATVNVNIELDEFSTDEILNHLEILYKSNVFDKAKIDEFTLKMKIDTDHWLNKKLSIIDEIKIDFLKHNLPKISINDLENLIK